MIQNLSLRIYENIKVELIEKKLKCRGISIFWEWVRENVLKMR